MRDSVVSTAAASRRSTLSCNLVKALGTDYRKEVEVSGAPGHIEGRRGSMSLNGGLGRMRCWRRVSVEVVGCGRIDVTRPD